MRTKKLSGEVVTFRTVDEVWDFMHFDKGTVYYRNGDDDLTLCREMNNPLEGTYEVWFAETKITEDYLSNVVGFVKYTTTKSKILTVGKEEYLQLPDDTLVAMLLVGEVPIYWIYGNGATLVDSPQTIYSGCPHTFGIKIR